MAFYLRPARPADLPQFVAWLQDPAAHAHFLPLDLEPGAEAAYARTLLSRTDQLAVEVRVVQDLAGPPLGFVRLKYHLVHATLSILLAAEARGRGLGRQVIRRVAAQTLADHVGLDEIRAFEAAGFVNTGEAPGHDPAAYRFVLRRAQV